MPIMTITCRHIISFLVLALYLFLPAQGMVHAAASASDTSFAKMYGFANTADSPCPDCPCNDSHDSGCCDTNFCSCAFHAPITTHKQYTYSPRITLERLPEPIWFLPQVYGSIFVPPQNPA